jgi:hypothetical protein
LYRYNVVGVDNLDEIVAKLFADEQWGSTYKSFNLSSETVLPIK